MPRKFLRSIYSILKLISGNFFAILVAFFLIEIFCAFLVENKEEIKSALGMSSPVSSEQFQTTNIISEKYELDTLVPFYPGWNDREINALLDETWLRRRYEFEAFTMHRERPFKGRYIQVHEAGFRISHDQAPWPPSPDKPAIFVFGGSTVFGHGLHDEATVVSFLTPIIRRTPGVEDAQVYNFGRSNYYSSQERILFQRLLIDGFVPDMAIFIDGVNEFSFYGTKRSKFALYLEKRVDEAVFGRFGDTSDLTPVDYLKRFVKSSATYDVLAAIARKTGLTSTDEGVAPRRKGGWAPTLDSGVKRAEFVDGVMSRYVLNKKMLESVGREFDVRTVFVLQPIPSYKYDPGLHPFHFGDFPIPLFREGYGRIASQIEAGEIPKDIVWCADIFAGATQPVYVDAWHYGELGSKILADCIWRGVGGRKN
jgi:hypothetical protein